MCAFKAQKEQNPATSPASRVLFLAVRNREENPNNTQNREPMNSKIGHDLVPWWEAECSVLRIICTRGTVWVRHWRTALRKHVFPKFTRAAPCTPIRDDQQIPVKTTSNKKHLIQESIARWITGEESLPRLGAGRSWAAAAKSTNFERWPNWEPSEGRKWVIQHRFERNWERKPRTLKARRIARTMM